MMCKHSSYSWNFDWGFKFWTVELGKQPIFKVKYCQLRFHFFIMTSSWVQLNTLWCLFFINWVVGTFNLAQVRSRNCHGRSISAERVFAGKFSYRKPIISSITACQMLLEADLLSQSTILCRQLLWSCADLFQADRDLAAAFYCGSGKFSYRKPIISSITACQMLLEADLLSQSTILCIVSSINAWPLLLEFDTYDSKINVTCKIRHLITLTRKLWTVWETLILRLILNNQDILKYHYSLDDFPLLRRVVFNISPCKLTTESLFAQWLVKNVF